MRRLRLDDRHANRGVNLRVQPDRNGVLAELLDRMLELDLPLVDRVPRLGQLVGDVLRGDRAEQPVAFAGLGLMVIATAESLSAIGLGLAPVVRGLVSRALDSAASRFLFPSVAS